MAPFQFSPLGDRAVVVVLGDQIEESTYQRVQVLSSQLQQRRIPGLLEHVPAFASVTIYYDPLDATLASICGAIEALLADPVEDATLPGRLVEIPVCYGGPFGEDLPFVARHTGLTSDEVIAIHCGVEYLVYMLGFAPGFPYLGGMSAQLATPRRETPRLRIPAGSVGIAGNQTGIYPLTTPGGWQLIGRTPLALFRPHDDPPTLLRAGDRLRFRPISVEEWNDLSAKAGEV